MTSNEIIEPSKKVGRPKIEIDFEILAKLCELHCTRDEICGFLEIDDETLSARLKEHGHGSFSTFYKKHLGSGKISLRRLQWKAANEGSVPMLIWLGKQMLGQSDKVEQNIRDVIPLPQFVIDATISSEDKRENEISTINN